MSTGRKAGTLYPSLAVYTVKRSGKARPLARRPVGPRGVVGSARPGLCVRVPVFNVCRSSSPLRFFVCRFCIRTLGKEMSNCSQCVYSRRERCGRASPAVVCRRAPRKSKKVCSFHHGETRTLALPIGGDSLPLETSQARKRINDNK